MYWLFPHLYWGVFFLTNMLLNFVSWSGIKIIILIFFLNYVSSSVSLSAVLPQTISSASKRTRLRILARSTTITDATHTARRHSATHTPRTVSTRSLRKRKCCPNSGCLQICDMSGLYTDALFHAHCCTLVNILCFVKGSAHPNNTKPRYPT